MKILMFVCLVIPTIHCATAQEVNNAIQWPVPKNIPGLLFYIQRDPDINTVCYTVKLAADGKIDHQEPVDIFWMKYATDGRRETLNVYQREFGYGLTITAIGPDSFQLRALALPNREMKLSKGENGQFEVQMKINQQECVLKRVFIRIVGGSALTPDVAYIEFFGMLRQTGSAVTEKLNLR